jgi:DNA-damage-inducible protein J
MVTAAAQVRELGWARSVSRKRYYRLSFSEENHSIRSVYDTRHTITSWATMGKTSTISARIDPETKERAEHIFDLLGLSASQAITLFYKQVELRGGLPFPVEIPNRATRSALKEAKDRDSLPRFESTEALFDDLEI